MVGVGLGVGRGGEILFMPPQVQHTALWVATVCECVRRAAAAAVLSKRTEETEEEEEEVASVVKSSLLHSVSVLFFGSVFLTFASGSSLFFFSLFYASERP